jgi:signal transduction histidine kinase
MRLPPVRLVPAAVVIGGALLCAVTAAVTLSGSASDLAGLQALARISMVAVPVAVGIYAAYRPPFERFGVLLIASGVGWFLTTLAGSDDAALHSIGRVAGWCAEPLVAFLLLSFPSGRLEHRVDRTLVRASALVVVVLYLPTAALVANYPVPAPWMSCTDACPENAFALTGSEPAFVGDVLIPLREAITIVIFAAVALRLAQGMRIASPLKRRACAPVLVVACLCCAAFAAALLARRVAPDAELVPVLAWAVALAIPALALAFMAGLVRWRLFMASSMQMLASRLRGPVGPDDLRVALAEAFDDPQLETAYWFDGRPGYWADAGGHPIAGLSVPPGRSLTEVRDGGRRVAAIVHDAALEHDRAFVDIATSYALMTLDHQRLSAQTSLLLREVRASRARIQAAADDERRRIERDLHDGAQQRLVALRIKLELAAERDGGAAVALRELGDAVDEAIEEVRSLARGIYPAPLAVRGLVEALRAAARRNSLPTTVLAAGMRRYPRDVESAAYFCCLEALQNASKHASGATVAVVDLSDNGSLCVEVRDDGAGFDTAAAAGGVGLTSMRDRLAAVGGDLAITSGPGLGTRIVAKIPLAPEAR